MATKTLAAILFLAFVATSGLVSHPDSAPPKFAFEVIPLKAVYHPNEPVSLRLILTNRGEIPVMVERGLSPLCCSDFFAFVDVAIVDARGRTAQKGGYATDSFLTTEQVDSEMSKVGKTDQWINWSLDTSTARNNTRSYHSKRNVLHQSLVSPRQI